MHEQADDELTWNSTYVEDEHADKVVLKSGLGVVRSGKDKLKCQIEATLYYQPYPRIEFRCVCVETCANAPDIMLTATQMKFTDEYFDVTVMSGCPEIDDNDQLCARYVLKTSSTVLGKDSTQVDELRLHIYNFEQFLSNRIYIVEQGRRISRLDYVRPCASGFEIEMRHVLKSTEQKAKMQNVVGFGMTHVAKITHSSGTEFCVKDALCHINAFGLTLSFLRGSFNFPSLISGYKAGGLVYESWSFPFERWHNHHNSFDVWSHPDQNTHYIDEIFAKFIEYIDTPNEDSNQNYKFLQRIIVTYVQANMSRYIPNSYILVQVAFETIAYQFIVERNKYMSKVGYTSLKYEADKFRLLFGYLGISADVSNYSTDLAQKLSKSGKTKYDIPRLLTEMRNSYIHADNLQSKNNALEGDDALQYLSVLLHILELTILAVIGYQGYYRNRLKNPRPGEVERVPWAK